jgi:hypothetical protein
MTTSLPIQHDYDLLRTDTLWGPGYGDRNYPPETLDEIAGYLAETTQPGYTARLFDTSPGYQPADREGRAVVPPGFDATGHPNRANGSLADLDPEITTRAPSGGTIAAGVTAWARARGWDLDQHGRPLHPHHMQLLADPRVGLPTGLGYVPCQVSV